MRKLASWLFYTGAVITGYIAVFFHEVSEFLYDVYMDLSK